MLLDLGLVNAATSNFPAFYRKLLLIVRCRCRSLDHGCGLGLAKGVGRSRGLWLLPEHRLLSLRLLPKCRLSKRVRRRRIWNWFLAEDRLGSSLWLRCEDIGRTLRRRRVLLAKRYGLKRRVRSLRLICRCEWLESGWSCATWLWSKYIVRHLSHLLLASVSIFK